MKKRVLLLKPLYHEAGEKELSQEVQVTIAARLDEDSLLEQLRVVEGAFVPAPFFMNEMMIIAGSKLEVICGAGVGDNIDLNAATQRGIPVVYDGPGGGGDSVAEHVIGLMLCLVKNLIRGHNALVEDGNYDVRYLFHGTELKGKILGVIGLGGVGKALSRKCHFGLEMSVIGYDPYLEKVDSFIRLVPDISTVFKEADFVSIHVPLTSENRKLIGINQMALMKRSAYFINTSRGGVIDEKALCAILQEKRIAGAALDVFDPEPPEKDNPLFSMTNVVLTPHIAGMTEETLRETSLGIAMQMLKVLRGEEADFILNPDFVRFKNKRAK